MCSAQIQTSPDFFLLTLWHDGAIDPEWSEREMVPMVLNAGDATFHSGMMAHAAAANMTPKPRRAMTCAYMPDGESQLGLEQSYVTRRSIQDIEISFVEIGVLHMIALPPCL